MQENVILLRQCFGNYLIADVTGRTYECQGNEGRGYFYVTPAHLQKDLILYKR